MTSDAYTPTTTQDDSQFQGFITLYRTQRAVPAEMPLPDRDTAVESGWGEVFADHIVIARGLAPDKSLRLMWIQHMARPLSFADQDNYNFSEDGTTLTRVYVMPRANYLAGYDDPDNDHAYYTPPPNAAAPLVNDNEDHDVPFSGLDYCYTGEKVDRIGTDPDSIFVAITRTWLKQTTVTLFHDDELDSDITQTRVIIAAGSGSVASTAGATVRIEPGNRFIDYQVTEEVVGFSTKKQLRSLMADEQYPFPMLMTSAGIVFCAAFADSDSAAASYNESFYFAYEIVDPRNGPYEARILRFLVADPDSLRADYPMQRFVTKREIIGTCRAYYIASSKGNYTYAQAQEREVPPCIHGDLEIVNSDTVSVGQSTDTLPATPNFAAISRMSVLNASYRPSKTRYGLYLIEITQINMTGLYSGVTVPFPPNGDPNGDTGAGTIVVGTNAPTITSAFISADNKKIYGVASKKSMMTVKSNSGTYAPTQTDENGNYSFNISPVPRDAVTFSVRAQRGGIYSIIRKVISNDLAPLAPSATISGDLTSAYGVTEPDATITLYVNLGKQTETITIPSERRQLFGIRINSAYPDVPIDGSAKIIITSTPLGDTPLEISFDVNRHDSPDEMAEKAAAAMNANADFTEFYSATFGSSGSGSTDNLWVYTKRVAPNDTDIQLQVENIEPTNLIYPRTTDASDQLFAGQDPAKVALSGLFGITVTSALFPAGERVNFVLAIDDGPLAIATKARFALAHSVVNNRYTIGGSGADISLKTRAGAPTDDFLNMAFIASIHSGVTAQPTSVNTESSGVSYTTTASDQGDWFIALDPPVVDEDLITVYASDEGGVSPATEVVASATPPTLTAAVFPSGDYNTITGTSSIAAVVKAKYKNEEIGTGTADGSGHFVINFVKNYIHAESIEVFATFPSGSHDIRSASRYVVAADLHLTAPVLLPNPAYPNNPSQFIGVAPVDGGGYADIVYQLDTGGTEYTVHPYAGNGNFTVALPGYNNERWLIWARYAVGDSDPVSVDLPKVDAKFAGIFFHYQGAIGFNRDGPDQKWFPESGYPAEITVQLTATALVANDTTLNIQIQVPTSSGLVAGAASSSNTTSGGGADYQVETATAPVVTNQIKGTAKVIVKSSIIAGAGGSGLVLSFDINAFDTPHIIASRAINKLNATSAVTAHYTAGSTGAVNQIALINPYPGACDITISFPGQRLADIVYSPATKTIYDLYPTGYLDGPPTYADVPIYFEVKVEVPDGRTSTNTFTRSLHAPYTS